MCSRNLNNLVVIVFQESTFPHFTDTLNDGMHSKF